MFKYTNDIYARFLDRVTNQGYSDDAYCFDSLIISENDHEQLSGASDSKRIPLHISIKDILNPISQKFSGNPPLHVRIFDKDEETLVAIKSVQDAVDIKGRHKYPKKVKTISKESTSLILTYREVKDLNDQLRLTRRSFITLKTPFKTVVRSDNRSAIVLDISQKQNHKLKTIDLRYHRHEQGSCLMNLDIISKTKYGLTVYGYEGFHILKQALNFAEEKACVLSDFHAICGSITSDIVSRFFVLNSLLPNDMKMVKKENLLEDVIADFMFTHLERFYSQQYMIFKAYKLGLNYYFDSENIFEFIYTKVLTEVTKIVENNNL